MQRAVTFLTSVILGLLLAGPLAALAIVAAPEQWRGPLVPWGVALVTVAVVVILRQPRQPPG